jgi:SAM-dependent methyltransferase
MNTLPCAANWVQSGVPDLQAPDDTLRAVIREYNHSELAVEYPFYDHEFDHHKLLVDLGLKHLKGKSPATILDIGTGRGICPRFFARLGHHSISLDFPVTGTNEALKFAAMAGVETHECDCSSERFPVSSGSVDCVYLVDVIEHFPHSPKFLMKEIRRVLRPGGVLIDSTFNAVRLTVRLKMLLGYSNWPRVGDYYDVAFHGGHHHEYTASELRYVHERAGLRNIEMVSVERNALYVGEGLESLQSGRRKAGSGPPKLRLARRLLYAATQLSPALKSHMYLVSQK